MADATPSSNAETVATGSDAGGISANESMAPGYKPMPTPTNTASNAFEQIMDLGLESLSLAQFYIQILLSLLDAHIAQLKAEEEQEQKKNQRQANNLGILANFITSSSSQQGLDPNDPFDRAILNDYARDNMGNFNNQSTPNWGQTHGQTQDQTQAKAGSSPRPRPGKRSNSKANAHDHHQEQQGQQQTNAKTGHADPNSETQPAKAPHEVLGVKENATRSEVRAAYKAKAREQHPDKHGNSKESTAQFQQTQDAYEKMNQKLDQNEKSSRSSDGPSAGAAPDAGASAGASASPGMSMGG